ncbi:hypothetical protein NO357_18000 [Marimonas arenosa]|uniref:Uncharacterized protein n=1 Tax=Marimonas arenosa TaxID=1795305 RepID=A0AAE3WFQ0_9RHOB|nr:hypothetical protein [Marimonas arenosa]
MKNTLIPGILDIEQELVCPKCHLWFTPAFPRESRFAPRTWGVTFPAWFEAGPGQLLKLKAKRPAEKPTRDTTSLPKWAPTLGHITDCGEDVASFRRNLMKIWRQKDVNPALILGVFRVLLNCSI